MKNTIRICAIRGRSNGDWHNSEHNQRLEVKGGAIYPTQSHQYKKIIMFLWKKKRKLKLQDQKEKAGVGMKTMGNGLESGNLLRESASGLWMYQMQTLTNCSLWKPQEKKAS